MNRQSYSNNNKLCTTLSVNLNSLMSILTLKNFKRARNDHYHRGKNFNHRKKIKRPDFKVMQLNKNSD
jgi:hypothetical protein